MPIAPTSLPGQQAVTAVILAGGKGRRMGGADKGLVELAGRPLVSHVIAAIAPQVDRLLINANRHLDAYARFGYPVVSDVLPEQPGPLAGILTALERATDEFVLIVPCDSPHLPADLLQRLWSAMTAAGSDVATVSDGQRLHPVVLLLRRRIKDELRRHLESGKRRVEEWLRSQHYTVADYSDRPQAFRNINTREEMGESDPNKQPGGGIADIPVIGFVAGSGTGKTTLLEQLIPELRQRGHRIALVKHTHHDFDIDQPGKDSHRLRKAGASQVLVGSKRRWALMTELEDGADEPDLGEMLRHLDQQRLDLVLVEGFKHENFPKIELRRSGVDKPPLAPEDEAIIAVASDSAHLSEERLPWLDLNDIRQIADFIEQRIIRS